MTGAVLITGGDGYLGLRIAERYLRRGDREVLLWIRARDTEELSRKRRRIAAWLGEAMTRVRIVPGDLRAAEPFAYVEPGAIGTIIHSAALTRFDITLPDARAVNVDGTAQVLAFAARCPRLERLSLLSTVYACGLQTGQVAETLHAPRDGFANFYEWSKWESEQLLARAGNGLPWRVLRIATVIADDESGAVTQLNAVHHTMRLFADGLLSLLPGDASTPLYFITGNFAADAIVELTEHPTDARVFHVAHERTACCTLGEVVDIAFAAFERERRFRSRRILPPLYCSWEAFAELAEAVDSFSSAAVKRAMRSIVPFARQLCSVKEIDNAVLRAHLSTYRAPDPRVLVARVCDTLRQAQWQRPADPAGAVSTLNA